MDRSKLVWFGAGLMLGLGVLLGATMQDGKGEVGRFQIMPVQAELSSSTGANECRRVMRLDTRTGKAHYWFHGIENKKLVNSWVAVEEAEDAMKAK